jgi:ketosteroid isomerase-like protein
MNAEPIAATADTDAAAQNLAIVRDYLRAVADPRETMATLGRFLDPDVVQEEFPNEVVPRGVRRDLAALQVAHGKGAQVITQQRYEIRHAVAAGDRVAVELEWTGTLQIAFGARPAGSVMRAHVAAFFQLRRGRIVAQRNYDCYEPWPV